MQDVLRLAQTSAPQRTGRFALASTFALAWLGLSIFFALAWIEELGALIGNAPAWLVIGGIALIPGYMNAFQLASLLLRRPRQQPEPSAYPGLTVLIAAFNEAKHIAQTLDSLAKQNYPGAVEIIVIDDGSSDDTSAVVRRAGHAAIRLVTLPRNGGKAAALNLGLQKARHALLVTVDADSWLHPDALRLLVREYLGGPPNIAAVAGAVFVQNPKASWVTRLQHWDYFHGIAATKRTQSIYGGTLVAQGAFSLYRTALLRELGGWPACVGEDIVLTWAMLRRGLTVGYAEEALCLTQVPESLGQLMRQRMRWARGMIEAFQHHPQILLQPRLLTFLVGWNLLYPWLDFVFTFCFIPGLILACFGQYWLVGPMTLTLLPSAALLGLVLYRMSARVFAAHGLAIGGDVFSLLAYSLAYGLVNHPAGLCGYVFEMFGAKKNWGTK